MQREHSEKVTSLSKRLFDADAINLQLEREISRLKLANAERLQEMVELGKKYDSLEANVAALRVHARIQHRQVSSLRYQNRRVKHGRKKVKKPKA
ncbi:hypothetical protein CYLTODRAFT_425766 [Cylindrobasidium torrendii FP15055 ss-10]|uniref:Uncharacterized protein n=1 Tax=Cylindrobasidium torrendii FP15055 ss-10 TaxID=1314674 RepID=A0A0D7B0V4_9AGAR|nr:hypothetical protein CYLTODRAFT_425766 [Cylindrobasidium torrendii FP15055 ss-10]